MNLTTNQGTTVEIPRGQQLLVSSTASDGGYVTLKNQDGAFFGRVVITNAGVSVGPYLVDIDAEVRCTAGSLSYLVQTPDAVEQLTMSRNTLTGEIEFRGPNGSKIPAIKVLRTDALYRWWGQTISSGKAYNITSGLSSLNRTVGYKLETVAKPVAMRVMMINAAGNAINNNRALVGTTETMGASNANELAVPIVGGTAYANTTTAGSALGFQSVTWGGAATSNIGAATTAQGVAISDRIPLTPVPRADGGSRYAVLYRVHHDGTADGNWAFCSVGATANTETSANRGRSLHVSGATGNGVTTPATALNSSTTVMPAFPVVTHERPVLSVWTVGDSLTQNDAIVADKVSSWGARACNDLTDLGVPTVHANMGASSLGSTAYVAGLRGMLAAGCPAPSVLVIGPSSVNDGGSNPTDALYETGYQNALDVIDIARQYSIPFVVFWGLAPYSSLDAAEDAKRLATVARLKSLAEANGVGWINEFDSLGDGASPEQWKSGYSGDGLHWNEATIDAVAAPALLRVLRGIVGV